MKRPNNGEGRMHRADAARLLRMRLETANRRHVEALAKIDADLARQRAECGDAYAKVRNDLDAAVTAERSAVLAAKADKARAEERRKAAKARLAAAKAERKGKTEKKRTECRVEADALRARKTAQRAHQKEVIVIERSILSKSAATSRGERRQGERREEVADDIPDEYKPLWKKVGRSFKIPTRKEGRSSLREAFIEYADESPDAVAAAQEEEAEREVQRLQREERKLGGGKRWRRMTPGEARESSEILDAEGQPIPF